MLSKDPSPPIYEGKEEQYRKIFDIVVDGLIIHDLESGLIVEANPAACAMHGYTCEELVGSPVASCIHPDSQYVFSEALHVFRSDSVFDIQILGAHQNGTTFYAVWRGAAYTYEGRPCLLSIVRDVNKRIQIEQILSQRVETRTYEQATLLEISHTLASTLELRPGLILDQLRKIIEYAHGGLFSLEGSALVTLAMRGTRHLKQSVPIRIQLNTPETMIALFNRHQPIRVANIWDENPQAKFLRSLLNKEASVFLEGMQSWMWIPLAVRGRIIGGIGVAESTRDYFTVHHAELALSVANQAAITMINAELYGHAQELAILEERQSLARNLHDAVNQSLFSAGLIAEVLPRLWERNQQEGREALEDLRHLTRGAQAEMRTLMAELRPTILTDTNLGDLLTGLGNALSGRTNLPVTVTASGELSLPADVQIAFYRVCQEALNNIAKHAQAARVEIVLKHESDVVELFIRDDGQGFDIKQKLAGHYGLIMMRERAEAAGTLLTVKSQPGHGTELTIRWMKTVDSKNVNN